MDYSFIQLNVLLIAQMELILEEINYVTHVMEIVLLVMELITIIV